MDGSKKKAVDQRATNERYMGVPTLEEIERQTGANISIATELSTANLSKCNLQQQSPLFRLPAEIRNIIMPMVAERFDDPANEYVERQFWWRPGHHAKHLYSTAFLRTCRRMWLEANALPMLQAEHCFWYRESDRVPTWCTAVSSDEIERMRLFLNTITDNGARSFQHLHLFAQMVFVDDPFSDSGIGKITRMLAGDRPVSVGTPVRQVVPKVLTLTIRHFDCWGWENGQQLHLTLPSIVTILDDLDRLGVETFRLELETLLHKVPQLQSILTSLRELDESRTHSSSAVDSAGGQPPPEMRSGLRLQEGDHKTSWSGPADGPWPNQSQYADMSQLDYRVVTLTWKRLHFREAVLNEADSLVGETIKSSETCENALLGFRERSFKAAAGAYEQQWAKEGSLLRFLEKDLKGQSHQSSFYSHS